MMNDKTRCLFYRLNTDVLSSERTLNELSRIEGIRLLAFDTPQIGPAIEVRRDANANFDYGGGVSPETKVYIVNSRQHTLHFALKDVFHGCQEDRYYCLGMCGSLMYSVGQNAQSLREYLINMHWPDQVYVENLGQQIPPFLTASAQEYITTRIAGSAPTYKELYNFVKDWKIQENLVQRFEGDLYRLLCALKIDRFSIDNIAPIAIHV